MKQGKKQKIFDFETLIIGITWALVLFMFTVSIVSCESQADQCVSSENVYCIERNVWYQCVDGRWDTIRGINSYCEDNAIYDGDPTVCDIVDEEIDFECVTWVCMSSGFYMRSEHWDVEYCDNESILP